MNSPSHVFDQAVSLRPVSTGVFSGQTSPAYQNMVGPFGGVTGATLLNAVLSHDELLGEPVSLTVHFAAPIAEGEFEARARPIRTNRSSQHWFAELVQGEEVVAFATAVTARGRDTWSTTDASFPEVPPAEEIEQTPMRQGAPVWTRCYDMRFLEGALGGQPSENHPSESLLWMRDEPPRPLDYLSLAALCDVFFPRIYIRRPKLVPIGTVALTTYFHADAEQLRQLGTAHVLGHARGLHFGKGFFDQSAEVWSADGRLLATSHQVVYFKE
jgi:acyl-CoA thioesterase